MTSPDFREPGCSGYGIVPCVAHLYSLINIVQFIDHSSWNITGFNYEPLAMNHEPEVQVSDTTQAS